jgi:hypothetical protein
LRSEELQEQAWPIVEPYFRQEMEKTVAQYQQHAGTDKAADNIEEIVVAAVNGRVDRLVLAVDTQVWGLFNRDTGEVFYYQEGQRKEDHLPLLDFAAMQTLQNGGTVLPLLLFFAIKFGDLVETRGCPGYLAHLRQSKRVSGSF